VASCTCPYALGYCKHIAAVLYGWLRKPGMFKDLGQSEDLLKKMDKGPLVETIIDMIKYDPDVRLCDQFAPCCPGPKCPATCSGR